MALCLFLRIAWVGVVSRNTMFFTVYVTNSKLDGVLPFPFPKSIVTVLVLFVLLVLQ